MVILKSLLKILTIVLPVLISVAYLTLLERKVMAAIQRQRGPSLLTHGSKASLYVFFPRAWEVLRRHRSTLSLTLPLTSDDGIWIIILGGALISLYFYTMTSKYICKMFTQTLAENGFITKKLTITLTSLLLIPHIVVVTTLLHLTPVTWHTFGNLMLALIVTQITLVLPTVKALANACKWTHYIITPYRFNGRGVIAWGSPIFFLHATRGILYPLFFIGFLVLARALILGRTIDMSWIYELPPESLVIGTYLACYYPCYFAILIKYARLRRSLWEDWVITMEAANITLAQNDIYFNTLRKFHFSSSYIYELRYPEYPNAPKSLAAKALEKYTKALVC